MSYMKQRSIACKHQPILPVFWPREHLWSLSLLIHLLSARATVFTNSGDLPWGFSFRFTLLMLIVRFVGEGWHLLVRRQLRSGSMQKYRSLYSISVLVKTFVTG